MWVWEHTENLIDSYMITHHEVTWMWLYKYYKSISISHYQDHVIMILVKRTGFSFIVPNMQKCIYNIISIMAKHHLQRIYLHYTSYWVWNLRLKLLFDIAYSIQHLKHCLINDKCWMKKPYIPNILWCASTYKCTCLRKIISFKISQFRLQFTISQKWKLF